MHFGGLFHFDPTDLGEDILDYVSLLDLVDAKEKVLIKSKIKEK